MKIALAGVSNVGKSTLFNALTGLKQRTVNAPGTTVKLEVGVWRGKTEPHEIIDLPGFYSFATISLDEQVASEALSGGKHIDIILFVLDATRPAKSLYLLKQLKFFKIPIVVAVTMVDILERRGKLLDEKHFTQTLGHPCIFLNPKRDTDFTELEASLHATLSTSDEEERYIKKGSLCVAADVAKIAQKNVQDNLDWVGKIEQELGVSDGRRRTKSDILDRFLLHPLFGPLIFLALMLLCFVVITTCAAPFIDFFGEVLGPAVANLLVADNPVVKLLRDGVLAGVITVLTFVPTMFFTFIFLGVLDSCGVLSRAAVVGDRLMRKVGLDGRALMPLILGYGCNLPAISATRIIPESSARKTAALLIPFTLCSARLAVFITIIDAVFPESAALVLFGLYLFSIIIIILVGFVLKWLQKGKSAESPFIVSLPAYQVPGVKQLLMSSVAKVGEFVKDASAIIITITCVCWFLQAVPLPGRVSETGEEYQFAAVDNVHDSVFGVAADSVSHIFVPLGFDNWQISSSLISGFIAKEAFVGTLEQAYQAPSTEDGLGKLLNNSLAETSPKPRLAALSLLLFILLYTPCMATIVQIAKEFNKRTAATSLLISLTTAYLVSLLVYQIGMLF
ncbi:MAG: ferrous iron transporter B [Candidatus Ancillula sp.]|jgi:ferrous iron transport protein B|nr:ferrous iron transporter B [Candidatus Ancillula sp.]